MDANIPTEVRMHLADGSVVLNDGRVVKQLVTTQPAVGLVREIQSGRAASETLSRIHRKLGDLPETPEKMNAIAAVLMYTAVGLNDDDIATALHTVPENIARLKELDAYQQLTAMFDHTVFDDAKRTANHIISRASATAAARMVEAVSDSDPNIAVVASRDVLKLSGVGADADSIKRIGGLNIKITRKGERSEEDISIEVT